MRICRNLYAAPLLVGLSLALPLTVLPLCAEDVSPFTVAPSLISSNGNKVLSVQFHVPQHHHLYADELSFEIEGKPAEFKLPEPSMVKDAFNKGERGMYATDFSAVLPVSDMTANLPLTVNLRGCSDEECYFPETRQWKTDQSGNFVRVDDAAEPEAAPAAMGNLTSGFEVARRASGYLGKEELLSFLRPGSDTTTTDAGGFAGFGVLATIGLILAGGLALNLTPCVLPMIPINLAILGAGANNGNRRRGFALGSTYGAGMALAYGGLGLAVVLTGSKFGTLNSSAWFNFAIAGVFCVMGLAMFDKIAIDLSRFQGTGGNNAQRSAFVGAGMMGAFAALLAGACVAPVVIAVLLLATTSYQHGNFFGLLFPFVLGIGMALPWPFAAAGLSFLPKPGRWMARVKYGFGVIIFLFAAWYGWLGWNLTDMAHPQKIAARGHGVEELRTALATSRRTGQPVFVDFWASWCKNCEAMEHTTFRDETVRTHLQDFLVVKFQAEHLNDPEVKPVLDELGVLGLPSYVLLRPVDRSRTASLSMSQSAR